MCCPSQDWPRARKARSLNGRSLTRKAGTGIRLFWGTVLRPEVCGGLALPKGGSNLGS